MLCHDSCSPLRSGNYRANPSLRLVGECRHSPGSGRCGSFLASLRYDRHAAQLGVMLPSVIGFRCPAQTCLARGLLILLPVHKKSYATILCDLSESQTCLRLALRKTSIRSLLPRFSFGSQVLFELLSGPTNSPLIFRWSGVMASTEYATMKSRFALNRPM